MPIYEFKCEECGKITVARLPISSKQNKVVCEFCKEYSSKRIISASTFVLKGGGWYAEGYSKEKK